MVGFLTEVYYKIQHFLKKLQSKKLNIPNAENVTGSSTNLPYVFVADDAFPLRTDMLKPFRQADLDSRDKEIFNYRLSRARRIVENAFGILSSRFRIYHTKINLEPHNIRKVVMATCALHNFLIEHVPHAYGPPTCTHQEDIENGNIVSAGEDTSRSNMEALQRRKLGNVMNDAKMVRDEFKNYFVNEGKVSWQDNFVLRNRNT